MLDSLKKFLSLKKVLDGGCEEFSGMNKKWLNFCFDKRVTAHCRYLTLLSADHQSAAARNADQNAAAVDSCVYYAKLLHRKRETDLNSKV